MARNHRHSDICPERPAAPSLIFRDGFLVAVVRFADFIGQLLLSCKPMVIRGAFWLPTLQPNLVSTFSDQIISISHSNCGFRRSRPGIPNVFRAPFQSDAAHQSNLMAPRVVSSRRPIPVIS